MHDLKVSAIVNREYLPPPTEIMETYAWQVWKKYHQQQRLPPPSAQTVSEFKQFISAAADMTARYLNRSTQSYKEQPS